MKFINPIHENDQWYIEEVNSFFPAKIAGNIKSYMQALYCYKSGLKGKRKMFFDFQIVGLISVFASSKFNRKVSQEEIFRFFDYFVYFINSLTLEDLSNLLRYDLQDQRKQILRILVYYYSQYVLGKKKIWSRRDVINEVFIESNLTPTQWDLNETRNTGRY